MTSVKNQSNDFKYRKGKVKIIHYPLVLGNHFIAFTFSNYKRESAEAPAVENKLQTIGLPLPSNLTEQVALSWSDGDTWTVAADNAAAVIAGGAASHEILSKFGSEFKDAFSAFTDGKVSGDTKAKVKQLTTSAKLNLPGGIGAAVSSFAGIATNPNIALVFKGQSGTREHTFNWKLVPENQKESELLRDIIREFRWQALPHKQSAYLLDYPNECKISLFGSELGYLPFFKKTVISSFEVNYNPEGIPTFMRGTGAPAAVSIAITFKETSQLFRNDIEVLDPKAKDRKLLKFNETANRKLNVPLVDKNAGN